MIIEIRDIPTGHKIDRVEIAFVHDETLADAKPVTSATVTAKAPPVAPVAPEPREMRILDDSFNQSMPDKRIINREAKEVPNEMKDAQF